MPLSIYPKQLFQEEWNIKPRPGRQCKVWKRVVDDIFESLELDKGEWVESISKGEASIKEFLALVDESIKESNRCQFVHSLCKSKLYGSGTGPLQYRSRPGRDTACQGKGKFGKLGGGKSCIVVYGSARSFECEAHGPSATATI